MKNAKNSMLWAPAALALLALNAQGATVDLTSTPLANGAGSNVKPNVIFTLDDSGSMGSTYLPDDVDGNSGSRCYKNHLYNRVYYNPGITYTLPVDAAGNSYTAATFTGAWVNGFKVGDGTTNLSTSFKAHSGDTAQAAYYYEYTGGGTPTVGTCYGNSKYTQRVISTAAEKQNFANWYSFYRTRMLMMKSSLGLAIKNMTNPGGYRLGFNTISYTGISGSDDRFLTIGDFCSQTPGCTQRTTFYQKLYGADPDSYTPLRAALSKIGQLYAGKYHNAAVSAANDPVQYSCQQNFHILSTDGYWNTNTETASYGPKKLNNSTDVGDQDGDATCTTVPTPYCDRKKKSNTLADVAYYYYNTDLRDSGLSNCTGALGAGFDVCENNVPGAGKDNNTKQHVTTFTLGLGVNGTLGYAENYESGGSADYTAILQGTKDWPDPIASSTGARIDDLWHAAVNGHGTYFSASDPVSLASGLGKALAGVNALVGSGAAAATSNLEPVSGDNYVYVGQYKTVEWSGDLLAKTIDVNTGAISATTSWSGQAMVDALVGPATDSRTLYTSVGGVLKTFTAANLSAAIAAKYFDAGPTNPGGALSQWPLLTGAEQTAATTASMIEFIRGRTGYEDQAGNTYRIYRDRMHALGDFVNSQPVYVKKPPFLYSDDNYADFADDKKTRQSAVYVGGNDGMVHAFKGDTGDELWAYIPSAVIPDLYRLADKNYGSNHRYYVDGQISVGDVCFTPPCSKTQWKTMLVGGLGKGGKAYYAMDVTDATNPKLLWEFTHANLGYSYGNALITKRNSDGKWVVIVSSGYNNTSGDSKGHLYVLDASNGSILSDILTTTAADPSKSGLSKINNWVNDTMVNNTTQYVYGGDLDGSVWRFDIVAGTATRLATIGKVVGAPTQPITTKPELGEVKLGSTYYKVVFVGGGRYLGTADIANTDMMSYYAIRDDLSTTYGNFRSEPGVVVHDLTGSKGARALSYNAMTNTSPGWYLDFDPESGERVNIDPKLQLGWLAVVTNIPDAGAVCSIGGNSWLYFLDYWPQAAGVAKLSEISYVGNTLSTGLTTVRLDNGKTVTIVTTAEGKTPTFPNPPPKGGGSARRVLWRELPR